MGWPFEADHIEAAKVIGAGMFGATVSVFLRHPGSLGRALFMVFIGTGIATIFSGMASELTGLGVVQSSSLLGMVGLVAARKILDAADTFDFSKFIPWVKK